MEPVKVRSSMRLVAQSDGPKRVGAGLLLQPGPVKRPRDGLLKSFYPPAGAEAGALAFIDSLTSPNVLVS